MVAHLPPLRALRAGGLPVLLPGPGLHQRQHGLEACVDRDHGPPPLLQQQQDGGVLHEGAWADTAHTAQQPHQHSPNTKKTQTTRYRSTAFSLEDIGACSLWTHDG